MRPDEFREWSKSITDRQFEQAVGDIYAGLGWETQVTKGKKDGGMDVILQGDDEIHVVSVKQRVEEDSEVSPIHLREIVGVAVRVGADKAILVTNSSGSSRTEEEEMLYTTESSMSVELVELIDLYQMVVQNDLFEITERYNTDLKDKVKDMIENSSDS